MAVYTDITEDELDRLLAGYDLGRPLSIKGVAEGIENSNFILETERGRFILTIYERRVREAELPYFLGLMQHLAAHGFPCPVPVNNRAGAALSRVRDKPSALVTFLSGLSVKRPTAAQCEEAGVGLARLHAAAAGFAGRRANDLGHDAWAPLFEPHRGAAARLEPGLDTRIAADLEALARAWPAGLPSGPIHADFFPDNVFFANGRFAGAIDFYFACDDALAYDLGICINAWGFDASHCFAPERARALIRGYERERALTPQERAALPLLARGSAMRFFLTRLIDWERGAAGALVTPKNPMDYAARLDFHRAEGLRSIL